MAKKRPWYLTKAAWAEAQAADFHQRAQQIPLVPSSNWRAVRGRAREQALYRAQARRFELLAAKLREQTA